MAPEGSRRRVLLLDMPRMLREIVRDVVVAEPRLELVGEIERESDLSGSTLPGDPEFVIVGSEGAELPAACRELFEERPHLKVLALTCQGNRGYLWELAPRRIALGELSKTSLVAAISDAGGWRWDA